jgi:uncharacterized membrane protein
MWRSFAPWLVSEFFAHLDRMGVAMIEEEPLSPMYRIARISIQVLNWAVLILALLGVFGPYTISISAIWICISSAIMLFGLAFLQLCKWMEKDEERKDYLIGSYLSHKEYCLK